MASRCTTGPRSSARSSSRLGRSDCPYLPRRVRRLLPWRRWKSRSSSPSLRAAQMKTTPTTTTLRIIVIRITMPATVPAELAMAAWLPKSARVTLARVLVDAHNDLLAELVHRRGEPQPFARYWRPELDAGGVGLQVCAIYTADD